MITSHHKSTIHRLSGDAKTIVEYFESIRLKLDGTDSTDEILFFLRKIVERCDYIASQIESEIKMGDSNGQE